MVTVVQVNYDDASEKLLVDGPAESVIRKPLFATFLRKHEGALVSESRIEVPCPSENLASVFRSLGKVLAKCNVELGEAHELSGAMQRIRSAEEDFEEFSQRAAAIWNGDLIPDEFQTFISILEEVCTGRRFYPRQLLSAFHLAFSQNSCNFSVPGAGKTSIVYAAYAYLNSLPADDTKSVNHILLVGPLSSFRAWETEYAAIFERPPNSRRISGVSSASARRDYLRSIEYGSKSTELTLTSYQTLYNSEDDFRVFLENPHRKTMMVLDEAHYIKRDDGLWASSILRLAPLATSRVILTGTPAPNGYEDLSNLFKFLYPDRRVIGFPSGTLRAMTEGRMPDAIAKLQHRVRPFYTRIRKSDLGLPSVTEHRVPIPLSARHQEIYSGIERLIVPRLRDSRDERGSTLTRARMIRLRQAATNPSLLLRPIEEDETLGGYGTDAFTASELEIASLVREFRPETELHRIEQLEIIVRDIIKDEGKVLVWSVFIGNLELLTERLGSFAECVRMISGATPVSDTDLQDAEDLETREAIIQRFHRAEETSILIANPQAVGESISLHKACDTAVYFDRDFNAGRYIQSKDRIHRYDPHPQRPKRYFHLIAERTVDEVIDARLTEKEERMAELIDSEEIPLFDIALRDESEDDIRAVIGSYERRKTQ